MGTKPCSICTSPARSAIDTYLIAGNSVRTAAQMFGLSASAVQRHRKNCMKRSLAPIPAAIPVPVYQSTTEATIAQQTASNVSQRVSALCARVEIVVQRYESTGNDDGLLRGVRELRECLRLMGTITGEIGPQAQVNVGVKVNTAPSMMLSPEWPVIMRVLDRHPEIRGELTSALTEAGL